MRGADVLVQTLQAYDVATIFALSGNQIMPVFDAVLDSEIRLVHTRHEAATVYMAEAYAQLSGQLGVALVTAGGGLGNAAGALIAAQSSDTPILLLSGDSPVAVDGCGAFQEMDQTGLTDGLTKASRRVAHPDDVAQAVVWAVELAMNGRRGPVHLSLPADVLTSMTNVQSVPPAPKQSASIVEPDLKKFHAAKRPLIILGPSLNNTRASGLADALRDSLHAPVVVMESPRGLNDPALGRFKEVALDVDYVLCLGKAIDFTLQFGSADHWPDAEHWDVYCGDAGQLEMAKRNLGARLNASALCDPLDFAAHLSTKVLVGIDRDDWTRHAMKLCGARIAAPAVDGLSAHDICQVVQDHIDQTENATLVCDGGEFGQWAQAELEAPRRVINGVSGVIGGGLGYAISAKVADPEACVFALMGDGTIGFHLAEFETAVRENLPFIAVVGNDNRWNAEHLIQTKSFGVDRQIGCGLSAARYDLAVAALGGFGAYVTTRDELNDALTQAVASNLPACINVAMLGLPAPTF